MSDPLANFRELKGIGPAIEARLHEAGVYTWEALSEVLTALGHVRGHNGDTLRELSDAVAARVSGAGGDSAPRPPGGERCEAFIVRMALAAEGRPHRTTVTHVRTQAEQPWPGWPPQEVIRFMTERSGVVVEPAGPGAGGDTAASRSMPATRPTRSRDHLVVLDAGKAVGGGRRSIELVVSTAAVADVAAFDYQATLVGRALGQAAEDGRAWALMAQRAGRAQPPHPLPLRFEAVELPGGIQRLRVEMAIRLPAPRLETPVLAGNSARVSWAVSAG
jgi:hypothetical protein